MDYASALRFSSSSTVFPKFTPAHNNFTGNNTTSLFFPPKPFSTNHSNDIASRRSPSQLRAVSNEVGDMNKRRSSLESLFCYDKPVPEEIIEKPIGLSMTAKNIGNSPPCAGCEAKGAVLCKTCSGSGLYVDSIMESQGIIVKVRCLGKCFSSFLLPIFLHLRLTDCMKSIFFYT
nr:putative heat shock protein DnaJ, cysteine-rich domain-containing protein [Ipomoea batatas]